jgi:hypothetical protein
MAAAWTAQQQQADLTALVTKMPPREDCEIAGKRLLAEAVSEHARLEAQTTKLSRERVIAAGLDPDEVLRLAREREAAANPKPGPSSSSSAGDTTGA